MRPVGALALHTRVGPCRRDRARTPSSIFFLAASRLGRGFIFFVAVLVGALVERDAGGSAGHSQEGGMTHIATPAPASMPNMKTTRPMVIFAGRPGHSGSRGGAV